MEKRAITRRSRRRSLGVLVLCVLAIGQTGLPRCSAGDEKVVDAFLAELKARAAKAEKEGQGAIAGAGGWLFYVPELRALSAGPFWGEHAAAVSRASNPQYADPLAAILDFHGQLQRDGIELLIVPVPAKAAVYPEMISEHVKAPPSASSPRLDPHHERFYRLLAERGVAVLDLTPVFVEQRRVSGPELYCKTDSHWSGRAIDPAAQAIAQRVRDRPWRKELPATDYAAETRNVEITGDLGRMLDEASPLKEALPLSFVGLRRGGQLAPVEPDRESPVLLMGDSHTLVFHDPALYARGAGLPDQLALRLGFPVDLIGIRGSGATTTRIELLRRRDNLKGKKLVVWCFSCREFTESSTGWRKIPVIR